MSINDGYEMRSWFDIYKSDDEKLRYCYPDIQQQSQRVLEIIEHEKAGFVDYKHIYLGGFSQGAIVCNNIALTTDKDFGGFIACSGFVCPEIKNEKIKNTNTILAFNGDKDSIIDYNFAKATYLALGDRVEFHHLKNTPHTIPQECFEPMREFLNK